jgi:hypothetical protein
MLEQAQNMLSDLLNRVPLISLETVLGPQSQRADALVELEHHGLKYMLILEVQPSAEPRLVQNLIARWRTLARPRTQVVLVAPWISPASRGLLEQAGLGYLDLQGNVRIVFGSVYIERLGAPAPKIAKRELRSLWKPASARALRLLLREPARDWNLLQLSSKAQISHAHAHTVKTELLNWRWIEERGKGRFKTLRLSQPEALLEAWQRAYEPSGTRSTWYTLLERDEIEQRVRGLNAAQARSAQARVILASFSAGRHLAPYARVNSEFLYAATQDMPLLRDTLELQAVDRGENLTVYHAPDEGMFLDASIRDGLHLTGPVQTYLDLSIAGNRGAEAAAHLLETVIRPAWKDAGKDARKDA